MFRGKLDASVGVGEMLTGDIKPEAPEQDPQISGGLLDSEDNPVTHIHGEVKVPGADRPISYSGSMPTKLDSNFMNIVVPGFGGIKNAYRSFERHMASDEGIFTISYVPARSAANKLDPQQVHEDTISAITQDIADSGTLDDLPNGDEIDLSEFSVILHSMGAIAGTRYALNNPDELRKLAFLNPVGFEEDGPYARYLRRIGPCAAVEILPGFIKGDFKDHNLLAGLKMGKHLFGNVVHTIGEVVTCHTADLRRDVFRLGKMGLSSAVILGRDDRLVPADPSFEGAKHLVDDCEIVDGLDHFGPQKHPAKTAAIMGKLVR